MKNTFLKFNLDSVVTLCYLCPCFEFEGGISETGQGVFLLLMGSFFGQKKLK